MSSSSSRRPVAEAAGSRTQLTGVVGAIAIAMLLVLAPQLPQQRAQRIRMGPTTKPAPNTATKRARPPSGHAFVQDMHSRPARQCFGGIGRGAGGESPTATRASVSWAMTRSSSAGMA
jgi:hypothetical protein